MGSNRELSASCQIDLGSVVKQLQGLRHSGIRKLVKPPDPSKELPLVELLAEETKFLRNSEVKPSFVAGTLIGNLKLPADGPLGRAAVNVSLRMEESINAPDYHNHQHVVEVMVAAHILGLREKLPTYRVAELIIAAAAHDLGHTGKLNQFDYERESVSFEIAQPILVESGLPAETIGRIEQMILATDFKVGVPPARENYLNTRSLPPLDNDRLLTAQCLLLTEADVLFSCFDLSYNEDLSKLLSREWNRPGSNLSLVERIGFLSYVRFLTDASAHLGLEERRKKLLDQLTELQRSQAG